VIGVPKYEPWLVNRWAFRTLAERAQALVTDVDDEQVLRQAVALDGIHFDLLSSEQSVRLALALERAADELRVEFRGSSDPRDRELADRLDDLRLRLSDITGS
jgi:hypothetical protein